MSTFATESVRPYDEADVPARDRRPVHHATDMIDKAICGLTDQIGQLEDRLGPVLSPNRTVEAMAGRVDEPVSDSPLAERLAHLAAHVDGALFRLRSITNAVEV